MLYGAGGIISEIAKHCGIINLTCRDNTEDRWRYRGQPKIQRTAGDTGQSEIQDSQRYRTAWVLHDTTNLFSVDAADACVDSEVAGNAPSATDAWRRRHPSPSSEEVPWRRGVSSYRTEVLAFAASAAATNNQQTL